MDKDLYEQYEYARKRLNQKKNLYFHFVLFLLGSIFLFLSNHFKVFGKETNWSFWIITTWTFSFIIHFIKHYFLFQLL